MKIGNVHIDSLNEEGNHFALSCEYKGARYHIWCDPEFRIDALAGGGGATLFKNPPTGTKYKGPGYFSTRHLRVDSTLNCWIINEMVEWAKRTNMLATARALQAQEKAAEQVKRDAAMLEHHKEKMGPEMFTLLQRLREDGANFARLGNYWQMDINEILDRKVKA